MAITNKRKSVQKKNLDDKLKSKLKENFDFMTEEDEDLDLGFADETEDEMSDVDLGDDTSEDSDSDLDSLAGEGLEDEGMSMDDLSSTQMQQLDSEVDTLLGASLEDETEDLTEEEDFDFDESETEMSSEEDMNLDVEGDEFSNIDDFEDEDEEDEEITDLINSSELTDIIDSPNSLAALEDELLTKITSEEGMEDEETFEDELMEEAEDPMKGMGDDWDKGYEGEDVKDELMEKKKRALAKRKKLKEEAELVSGLKELDFEEVEAGLNDDITDKVTDDASERSADDMNADIAGVVQESVKKSKMLVKAASAIVKLQKMLEASKLQARKLTFENSKLSKSNAILAVAGDKMTKEVRKKMTESFSKCKSNSEVDVLYKKVIGILKEHNKPSVKKMINKAKPIVKTTNMIKENKNPEVKLDMSKDQKRKAYLMGLNGSEDMYYNH